MGEYRHIPARSLRSASSNLLIEPSFRLKTIGSRAFHCVAPRLWNNLPPRMRQIDSLLSFKKDLKTLNFKEAYCD